MSFIMGGLMVKNLQMCFEGVLVVEVPHHRLVSMEMLLFLSIGDTGFKPSNLGVYCAIFKTILTSFEILRGSGSPKLFTDQVTVLMFRPRSYPDLSDYRTIIMLVSASISQYNLVFGPTCELKVDFSCSYCF